MTFFTRNHEEKTFIETKHPNRKIDTLGFLFGGPWMQTTRQPQDCVFA